MYVVRDTGRSQGLEIRKAFVAPFVRQDQHDHDITTADSPREKTGGTAKALHKTHKTGEENLGGRGGLNLGGCRFFW